MNFNNSTILDILALLGGGRGDPLNNLTPHMLAAIFWGSLALYLFLTDKQKANTTDSLLIGSFCMLFYCEFSQAFSALVEARSYVLPEVVQMFGPSLQNGLCNVGTLMLTAAFLQFLLRRRQLTRRYLHISFMVTVLIIIYELLPNLAALWIDDNAAQLSERYQSRMASGIPIMVLLGYALYKVLGSLRQIRWPIIIAMVCLLMERFLALLVQDQFVNLAPILDPIRGNLQLWAIPLVAYVALRVRHVEGKRLERGLQATERLEALGQLSSGIAHDFNNHLQIILGYTELAKSNTNLDRKQRLPLRRIEEAAQSAGALVNQLLAFSRGQPTKFQPVDLNEVITRLTPMLSRLLGPDIRLVNNLDFSAQKVMADVNMIDQIIINLVVNAKDAIIGTGAISIQSRALTRFDKNLNTGESGFERTQLLVTDTGVGMDEKTARRIFEPFFTTKPVGKGTGLGLSTVYSAVQKHNGTIFVKSEPGKYTRVYMEFPVCRDIDSGPLTTPAFIGQPVSHGETILLAEDETAIRDLASTLLETAGYNLLIAHDGQHAIDIMRTYKGKVDLCIFDVTMPVLNGYDTYDHIAADRPDLPVVFITGNTSRVAHVRSHLPHLQKPFSKSALFAQVRHALADTRVS